MTGRNIYKMNKVESLNPTPKCIVNIYTKKRNNNKYPWKESLKFLMDSGCMISLMSLETCTNLGLRPKKLNTPITLVNRSEKMGNFEMISFHMKAQNGKS